MCVVDDPVCSPQLPSLSGSRQPEEGTNPGTQSKTTTKNRRYMFVSLNMRSVCFFPMPIVLGTKMSHLSEH